MLRLDSVGHSLEKGWARHVAHLDSNLSRDTPAGTRTNRATGLHWAGHDSEATLLGLLRVSVLHNLVHLAFGVVGVFMARQVAAARAYGRYRSARDHRVDLPATQTRCAIRVYQRPPTGITVPP
ncbi:MULTISPECIES: DUF4383 domain-containing protein [Mycobacterium]|uniref:DUF4383 domain-containing protein n=1 Tax=Mycobacterium TaxID=1763 RepID=UPI000ABE6B7F